MFNWNSPDVAGILRRMEESFADEISTFSINESYGRNICNGSYADFRLGQ